MCLLLYILICKIWRVFMISSFAIGTVAYSLFDDGLANVLGLETLRHGTNPINYVGMRINGGDPSHGGKDSGSNKGITDDKTTNLFYVFKDNEFPALLNDSEATYLIRLILNIKGLGSRMVPRMHVALSGYNFIAQAFPKSEDSKESSYFSIFCSSIGGIFSLLITPTVRFRFSEIDPTRFTNDNQYDGIAYKTSQVIESWRIGLLGTILTGINLEWFSRIRANPIKILTGVVQLTCAIAISVLCISALIANPILGIPALAGALLI